MLEKAQEASDLSGNGSNLTLPTNFDIIIEKGDSYEKKNVCGSMDLCFPVGGERAVDRRGCCCAECTAARCFDGGGAAEGFGVIQGGHEPESRYPGIGGKVYCAGVDRQSGQEDQSGAVAE